MEAVIETTYGKVEGFTEDDVLKWLGIPYAKPPIKDLRFRRAVECDRWEGIKPCKSYGNKPIQFSFMESEEKTKPMLDQESEDCLYLNIWRPNHEKKNLPVFVWIYGGAFHMGEGSDLTYSGTSFARQDVLYITFNYRVGVLGFYDFTMYDADSFDSNCGLSDQIQALKWIKQNIEYFGGDPNNITIAGESAGGSSCCALLASPAAQGLVNKAIIQSPVVECAGSTFSMKLNIDLFLEQMNVKPEQVASLRELPAEQMLAASRFVQTKATNVYPGILVPAPTFDDLLPEHPVQAFANGAAADVTLIIGTNRDEGSLLNKGNMFPTSWELISKMLEDNQYGHKLNELKSLYQDKGKLEYQMNLLTADRAFLINSIKVADAQSAYNKVWMYRFDFVPFLMKLSRLGAVHGCEIPLALNTLDASQGFLSGLWKGTSKKARSLLIQWLHGSWIQFAKTGDPNGEHLPIDWVQFNENTRPTLIIDKKLSIVNNPNERNYEVWQDIALYQG